MKWGSGRGRNSGNVIEFAGQRITREVVGQDKRYHRCDLKIVPPRQDGRKLTNGPRTSQPLNLPYHAEWRYIVCFHYSLFWVPDHQENRVAADYRNVSVDRCSSVGIAMGWTVRGSNPGGYEIFRTCPDQLWSPPSLLYNGYRVFLGGKTA